MILEKTTTIIFKISVATLVICYVYYIYHDVKKHIIQNVRKQQEQELKELAKEANKTVIKNRSKIVGEFLQEF